MGSQRGQCAGRAFQGCSAQLDGEIRANARSGTTVFDAARLLRCEGAVKTLVLVQ